MDELVWIALVLIGILALPIILAIVAMNKAERVSRELFKLRGEISQLRTTMVHPIDTADRVVESAKSPEQDFVTATTTAASNSNETGKVAADPTVKAARSNLEENLAGTWFIWIGAVAIGLAGLFLVKYMSDAGLLGPGIRIVLGLVCGFCLAVAGEWLRRKPSQKRFAALSVRLETVSMI